jgi:hypothetical protein
MKSSQSNDKGTYKLLRGARVLQALVEASSYNNLYQDIEQGFPNTQARQHATNQVAVKNIQYVPVTRGLNVKTVVTSGTNSYQPHIMFLRVKFLPQATATSVEFMATDGTSKHIEPIDLNNHNVRVRCNCLDFYFRFSQWNYNDDSLIGRKPPLYRPVPGSNRPPVNPMQVPGLCKHVIKVVEHLQKAGIVKN